MNTNSTQFKKQVFNYILTSIDTMYWNVTVKNQKELVDFVYNIFKDEQAHNIKYFGNEQVAFANYLAGLPSIINIDYENYKILEIAKSWGSIPENATEKQEEKILSNWFNFIASNFFQLKMKLNLKENLPSTYKL